MTPRRVWLPGGYPELHAGTLARRHSFGRSSHIGQTFHSIHGECGAIWCGAPAEDARAQARDEPTA